MSKYIIASNRFPVIEKLKNQWNDSTSGGLPTGLKQLRNGKSLWIGWRNYAEEIEENDTKPFLKIDSRL